MARPQLYPLNTRVTVFETSEGLHPEGVPGVIAAATVSVDNGVPCQRVWLEDPSRVEWVPHTVIVKSDVAAE
jgi:hypothetical protein